MSEGQRLIEQGRVQGLEQGRVQGIEQGARQSLLRLLRRRFGDQLDPTVEQRVAAASLAQLEQWTGVVG